MRRATIVTIIFLAVSPIARAADDEAATDALITKGLQLRLQGRTVDAIELFQKAVAIAPSPRSFGQLGLAESAVEHWADADEHLDSALAFLEDPWVKRNSGALDQASALVRAHIGQIFLTGPAGAAIVISGRSIGTLPLDKPICAEVGSATVTATEPGFRRFEMSVPVEVGKETQLKIVLEPLESPPPPQPGVQYPAPMGPLPPTALRPEHQPETGSFWRSWTGGSMLVAGGGVAAWGIVWIALNGHSSNGWCSAGARPGCVPVYNTQTPGIILTGVGAAAAIAGGILLYTAERHDAEVGVAVGAASLSLAGRF